MNIKSNTIQMNAVECDKETYIFIWAIMALIVVHALDAEYKKLCCKLEC